MPISSDPAEYLAQAKQRALEYLNTDNPSLALASLLSDLRARPDLFDSEIKVIHELGVPLAAFEKLNEPGALRDFINGFGGPVPTSTPQGSANDTTERDTARNG